jgi:SNF2 family DNA or RNA helicase
MISKPSIMGYGLNFQHCATMIFAGIDDSFEKYYQAVRRCHRFGQKKQVTVHIITAETEGAVKANIERKQRDAERMTTELVKFTKDILAAEIHQTVRISETYITSERMEMPKWIA